MRIISCYLPKKSPWLNPIEPKWTHGKRRVVEADGLLSAHELAERVCSAFGCPHHEHLSLAEKFRLMGGQPTGTHSKRTSRVSSVLN